VKKLLGYIPIIVVGAVILPLILGFLFAFPIEFLMASWHSWRADSMTTGVITRSEVSKGRHSTEGSDITYSYNVDGRHFSSTRRCGGLITNASRESGGGIFAREHPVGSEIAVHYDSSDPAFSLLEPGWPKWSIGFSILVWGVLFSNSFKRTDRRTARQMIGYSLSRAAPISGFIAILGFPTIMGREELLDFLLIFASISLVAFGWLMLGKTKPKPKRS